MKSICASCIGVNPNKIIRTDNTLTPAWLADHDYVTQFIQSVPLTQRHQKYADIKLKLDVGQSRYGRLVLFWAAEPSSSIVVRDAKKAYGRFRNFGVAKVDRRGEVTLKFCCPQPYSTTVRNKRHKETFYRHVHFCYSDKHGERWQPTVYTKIVVCKMNLKKTLSALKKGSIVLINALPSNMYGMSHIPNSFNLHHKQIKQMSQEKLIEWFRAVVKLNYRKLNMLLSQKKLNVYELPIVIYCGHDKCNLSHKAAKALLRKGFVNVSEFPGGMKKYQRLK